PGRHHRPAPLSGGGPERIVTVAPASPSTFDDRLLRDLAVEPPQPLFSVLRHAEAMGPLVIVLAFLPALYAAAEGTLSEAGARQALLSLDCVAARSLSAFVDPASAGSPPELAHQPLLMNWLTAFAMHWIGVGRVAAHVVTAYLCTSLLVVATFLLARR